MNPTTKGALIGVGGAVLAAVVGWVLGLINPASPTPVTVIIREAISKHPPVEAPQTPEFVPSDPVPQVSDPPNVDLSTAEQRYYDRERQYKASDYIQLAHILTPSKADGQIFDIYIWP